MLIHSVSIIALKSVASRGRSWVRHSIYQCHIVDYGRGDQRCNNERPMCECQHLLVTMATQKLFLKGFFLAWPTLSCLAAVEKGGNW